MQRAKGRATRDSRRTPHVAACEGLCEALAEGATSGKSRTVCGLCAHLGGKAEFASPDLCEEIQAGFAGSAENKKWGNFLKLLAKK